MRMGVEGVGVGWEGVRVPENRMPGLVGENSRGRGGIWLEGCVRYLTNRTPGVG